MRGYDDSEIVSVWIETIRRESLKKKEIEHVVNNERDVSKDRDIELIVRWNAETEDILFNVLVTLDLT